MPIKHIYGRSFNAPLQNPRRGVGDNLNEHTNYMIVCLYDLVTLFLCQVFASQCKFRPHLSFRCFTFRFVQFIHKRG